jgi:hypothetical protein
MTLIFADIKLDYKSVQIRSIRPIRGPLLCVLAVNKKI